ncbi:MAG TPA: VWA domain-containing protein [Pyrinomonadaceae bacterium]|nr:VWA domain-containing protein [Pyrinomonadaceae bacterium]
MNKRLSVTLALLFSLVTNSLAQQPVQPTIPTQSPERMPAAQQPSPSVDDPDIVRITANLVQIDAVVTKDRKHVTDLKPEDFEILEDGKPQTITQFSYVSNVPVAPINNPSAALSQPREVTGGPVVPVKARPNEARRTVLLVIDDLGISGESLHSVRKQLRNFLDKQLQPNDLVAIVKTGGSEVGALQQFTTDKRVLSSAVESLKWHPCSRGGTNVFGGGMRALCSGTTFSRSLAVIRFALRGMRELPGRKSMVIFSDDLPLVPSGVDIPGFDDPGTGQLSGEIAALKSDDPGIGNQLNTTSSPSATISLLERLSEMAIRASVVIYAVDTRGLQVTGWQARDTPARAPQHEVDRLTMASLSGRSAFLTDGRQAGQLIAKETGGFAVYNSNDFGLQRVMDDQRGYYLIGYRPNDETFNRRFHHIKVRVKGSGLEVRTRKGFYGVTEEEATQPGLTVRDRIGNALSSPFGANDVNLRLTTIYANDPAKGPLLRSLLFLSARDLVFKRQPDGMQESVFDLSSVVFGDSGKIVGRHDEKVTLRLRPERYDQVMREGIVYKFDRPVVQAGAFQFRVALHDPASSRIGAAGQFIEVPKLQNGQLAVSGILVGGEGAADQLSSGPAVRQFPQDARLNLAYLIYNAAIDPTTRLPKLTAQTRIFRDGKLVYTGNVAPIDLTGQSDLQRIAAGAQLQLGSAFTMGDYVLQVSVEDQLAKEKQRTVTQWIDFAIVK